MASTTAATTVSITRDPSVEGRCSQDVHECFARSLTQRYSPRSQGCPDRVEGDRMEQTPEVEEVEVEAVEPEELPELALLIDLPD